MNIQNNAHEMEIKLLCARWLERKFGVNADGILINEFSANKSKVRADLVYVSPSDIVAIEIKSKNDKTTRLEKQVKLLKKIYNRVEIITVPRHYSVAKDICTRERVGLHIVENSEIRTILKGFRRNLDAHMLRNLVFPISVQIRTDFVATENYYRDFLLRKYRKSYQTLAGNHETGKIDATYIRSLNPHHIQRIRAVQKKIAYQADLEALSRALQSTHSSSSSSDDTPSP
jgi:hypothetical protein